MLPYRRSIAANWLHAASWMLLARRPFWTMLVTLRSSSSDDITFVDNATTVLVRKVLALPTRSLMCPCDHLAALLAVFPGGLLLRILAHRFPEIRLIQLG